MAAFALQPGHVVGGRYLLRAMVGVGGMGAVWSATDQSRGVDVAVKFLHPTLLNDPLMVQRFLQEGEVGQHLEHPFIIETHAAGRHVPGEGREAFPYLVTELLDGESLSDVLRRMSRIPLGPALVLMSHVAQAAEAAHQAGVLHRDLKPGNVFLHRDAAGQVVPKVLDFGISKLLDPSRDVGLTTTGVLVGSPTYVSPEQALGKRDIDGRSDIWSIGVMLHRVLTGEALFSQSGAAVLGEIVGKDVTLAHLQGFPEPVLEIVRRCLRRDRTLRFAHAVDLARALDDAVRTLGLRADLTQLLPQAGSLPELVDRTRVMPCASDAGRLPLTAAVDDEPTRTPLGATTPIPTGPAPRQRRLSVVVAAVVGVALAIALGSVTFLHAAAPAAASSAAPLPTPLRLPTEPSAASASVPALPSASAPTKSSMPPAASASIVVPSARPSSRDMPVRSAPPRPRGGSPSGTTVIHDPGF